MKCRECNCCKKGYFESKPEDYVCIGVKEPFVISDINVECTEYPEYRNKETVSADEEEGYWFLLDDCANEGVYCSKCHKKVYKKCYANQKLKSKFCPNCGKRMSGEFKVL